MPRSSPASEPSTARRGASPTGRVEGDPPLTATPRRPGRSGVGWLADPGHFEKLALQVAGRQGPLDRLREGIEAAEAQQAARRQDPPGSVEPGPSAAAAEAGGLIEQYLRLAARAYGERNANLGWGFLHRLRETETLLMTRTELDAVAVSLAAECSGSKVSGWRRDAIQGLLQRMHRSPYPVVPTVDSQAGAAPTSNHGRVPGRRSPADREWLRHDALLVREALATRNGHFSNIYVSLAVTAHRRLWLLFLGVLLLAAVAVLLRIIPDLDPQGPLEDALDDGLVDRWLPLTMAAVGALGSVVSAIQRLAVDPLTGPIPAQLGSFTATVTRPLIGAVAALTVFLAARGGIAVPEQHPVPLLLLAAFTAGLTERLVVYREGGQPRQP
jgi:hypothetical protein